MRQARSTHTATLLPSGKVLVVGGTTGYGFSSSASAELYDPATGTWTAASSMGQGRYAHTATLLPSGKVLVVGGYGSGIFLPSAELYDPATGTWTATAPLTSGRGMHTATLLPSGKVLVAAGAEQAQPATSEVYEPHTGTWTVLPASAQQRYGHTATLLPSGQVLMTGGYTNIATSEVYDDTAANAAWRPELGSITAGALLEPGSVFTVNGSRLRGLSEASSGDSRSSPTDFPLLTLMDLERGRLTALPSQDFSDTHVTARVPGVLPGQYLLSVTVNGLTSGTVLSIAAGLDAEPPTVTLTTPGEGETLKGTVTLSATAADNFAVTRVEFYNGATLLGTDTAAPYSFSWDTRTVANGAQLLSVKAYDAAEQPGTSPEVSVTVDNDLIAPTVALLAPTAGATVTGTVTSTATATDNRGVIRVEFHEGATLLCTDTSAPYTCSWNTRNGPNGSRTLTARAYDAGGNLGITEVTVTADNDLTPPAVILTAPAEGATLTGTVTLAASASDAVGITQVVFFAGTTLVGTATTAPYSLSYNTRSLPNGAKALTARAYDAAGNVGTSATVNVTFSNDLLPPNVTLTGPGGGATLKGTVTLSATASDNFAVTRVEFYDGATLLGTDTTAPYNLSWDTRTVANGSHQLTAKAYDAVEQSGTSPGVNVTVNNDLMAPTVALSAPKAGATVTGTVASTATATDNVGVVRVEFHEGATLLCSDTAAPYSCSWNTRNGPNGSRTLTARAYDAAGYSDITEVTVTADNDFTPPAVTLTAPAEGATVSGTITLTAAASDDRAMARVAFFAGTTQVGTDNTAPYSFSYNTRGLPNGAKALTARAYDAAGNVGTSAPVDVIFENDFTPPTVTLTSPSAGETLTGTVTLTATASDDRAVARVAFFAGTTQVGTDNTAPYAFSYNTRSLPNGAKALTAKAYDAVGNVGTSAPVNVTFANDLTAPTTSITSPASGSTLSGVVQISAIANDDQGTITKVDFYQGALLLGTVTTAPYTWAWDTTKATVGTQTLKTRAWDGAGNSAYSTAVTVTVTR